MWKFYTFVVLCVRLQQVTEEVQPRRVEVYSASSLDRTRMVIIAFSYHFFSSSYMTKAHLTYLW